jgi:hypothetical protein
MRVAAGALPTIYDDVSRLRHYHRTPAAEGQTTILQIRIRKSHRVSLHRLVGQLLIQLLVAVALLYAM